MKNIILKIIIVATIFNTLLVATESTLDKVKLQLQWKYQFQFAGFIVAKEYGYYKDVGLEVEILEYNNSNIIEDLENGTIDFGINNSIVAYHNRKLNAVTLLASYFQRSPLVLITQPEIQSMLDLEGKRVMMSEGNRYNSSLTTLLDYFNLNNDKVDFLKPSFDIQHFIDKKVDVITGFRSNELYELDKKNIPYNVIDPVSYGFSTNAINLFSSSKKVEENPKQIKQFLSASKKGWEYALSHIEEVAELIHKKYQPNKTVEHLIYEGKRTAELMLVDMYEIGEINEEFVLKTLTYLMYQKKVDQNQSIENLFIKKDSNVLADTLLTFTEEEKKWIEKHPIVSFTGDPNWLPYESFEADGSYIGIVAEYLRLITKLSGLRFEPQPVRSWTEALEMARNSRVKVISGDSADKKLNQKFHPVRSYSHNPIVIIMDTKYDYVEDLNIIADKKIAIIKDYGYTSDVFKTYPKIKFIEVENIQEGLEGVVKGDFDAMLATMALASYTIQEMQLHTLKIVGKTPIVMHLTLFVSKDEPLLHSIINKTLRVITKEQKHQIMHKWTENKYIEKVDYRLLWQVSGVLTVLLLLLLAWSYRMRIEIKKREILELKNREIQERLSFALQGSNDGLWDWNFITNDVYFSPRWKEILGYKESEIVNKFESWESLLHPDDIKSSWDELNRYLGSQDKSDRFTIKFRMKHKDGHFVPILSRANKVYNDHSEVVRMVGTHVDLTELIKVQEAYKRERDRGELYLDTVEVLIMALDIQGCVTMLNRKGEELLGYKEEELLGKNWFETDILPKEISEKMSSLFSKILSMDPLLNEEFEHYLISKSGEKILFSFHNSLLFDNEKNCIGVLSSGMDITEKVKAKQELVKQHAFLEKVMGSVGDAIIVIENDYSVSMMNKEAKKMIDTQWVQDIENPKCYEISHHRKVPCDGIEHPCPLQSVFETKAVQKVSHLHQNLQGENRFVEVTAVPLLDQNDEVYAIIESTHDVTELKKAQQSLQHQAEHDALTDLPNRILFVDRLNQAIKNTQRTHMSVAILFIDLDHFKEINDSLGHSIGDILLKSVSHRLKNSIRQSDTVARQGGDEFTIVLDNIKSIDNIATIVEKIMLALKEPFMIETHQLYVTLSIGVAVFPNDGVESEILLKNADAAMYKAKKSGRDNYQFYTEDMTEKALERVTLETELRQSLDKNQMQLYYQAQVDARDEKLLGMEALLRWRHPEMGLVSPAKFIPLAEETGFIVELDEWVMREALAQFKQWYDEGLNPGIISLNLSLLRLEQKDFIKRVKEIIEQSGASASWVTFEVTEGQIMRNPYEAIKTLNMLNDLGIQLAIDDFGTGYSSLSYLTKLPIEKLKIDQSFVRNLPENSNDAEIVRTIISMSKGLNLSVIAEGVETKEQKEFLLESGSHEVQGYLYHKPSIAKDIEREWLHK